MITNNIPSEKTTLFVKNMVCNRCIKVVKEELQKLGYFIISISLGEVEIRGKINTESIPKIREILELNGFELIENNKAKIIEKIKKYIIRLIHYNTEGINKNLNYSSLIEEELHLDYNYLSGLFSSLESITIEQFIILQRIERAKELLKYGELTLSEISYQLGYSSVQHLSRQFKQVTGLTASQFKKMTINMRRPLDSIK